MAPARGRGGRLRLWRLVFGFTRAAPGSRFWCCCTALARLATSRAAAADRRPAAGLAARAGAAAGCRGVSGWAGRVPAGDPAVDAGLREQDGRWRLAMDPGAFAVGAPDMAQLLTRSQAPVTLARGEHDPMNTDEQLAGLGAPTVTLPGLGHNAHAESPELAIALLDAYR